MKDEDGDYIHETRIKHRKVKMKLSYSDPETENMSKEKLIEFVIGVKPENTIGKVTVDGLFPASQFHFRLPERITEPQSANIRDKLSIPFCGMIDVQFRGSRVIVTTACPAKEREAWSETFANAINEAIDET